MEKQCALLIGYALRRNATDIHFQIQENRLLVFLRDSEGLHQLKQDIFKPRLYEYLKYRAGLDLTDPYRAQSGEFSLESEGRRTDCRFAVLQSETCQSGVLRILHDCRFFEMQDLTSSTQARQLLSDLCGIENGLIVSCGPTGSGKTTTVHTLLRKIDGFRNCKIMTLEDPVEIRSSRFVQIQINEARGQSYERMLEEILRQDPNLIFLGECRSAESARIAVRAALTGHLVITTLHAGSGRECLYRLMDLGIPLSDLKVVLKGIFAQRLISSGQKKECIYEIWKDENLEALLAGKPQAIPDLSFAACRKEAGLL